MVERPASRFEAALRITATPLGTLPVAVLCSLGMARFLPMSEDARLALSSVLAIPIWVSAMCLTFLARDGARAWLWCIGLTLLLGATAIRIP